jgi:hypothetical protein
VARALPRLLNGITLSGYADRLSGMWIPNVRDNEAALDDIPWWERLLCPVTLIWLLWICLRGTWQFWLYPESHLHECEMEEQSVEYARLTAYRKYRSRVGTWRRLLEKAHLVTFDRGPFGDAG